MPILILMYPEASPSAITSLSRTVVFFNALSATVSNVWSRRVDLKTAGLLAVGAVPALVLGSLAAGHVSREHFRVAFGVMLLVGAVYTLWRSRTILVKGATTTSPTAKSPKNVAWLTAFMSTVFLRG